MNFLNKATTYVLTAAAGLSVGLSAAPHQASAINLVGQNQTTGTPESRFKGQTVDFTVGGNNFPGSNTQPGVIVNSIKFALNTNTPGLIADAFRVNIFDVTSANPTFADTVSGAGSLATSDLAVYTTPDGSFNNNVSYLLFTFVGGTPELATNKQYGFFLNAPSGNLGFTDANTGIRGDASALNSYSGGQGFREGTGAASGTLVLVGGNGDSAFIIDATAVPFEFEASGGVAILGGLFLANKYKNRKQTEKSDEQA